MSQSHPIIQQYNYFQDTFGIYGGPEGNLTWVASRILYLPKYTKAIWI